MLPIPITFELRLGRQTPVGDYDQDRPFQRHRPVFFSRRVFDDFSYPQALPEFFDDVKWPMVPSIQEPPSFCQRCFQGVLPYTSDKLLEAFHGVAVDPADRAQHPNLGPAFFGVPGVFGDLKLGDGRTVGVLSGCFSQVHYIY